VDIHVPVCVLLRLVTLRSVDVCVETKVIVSSRGAMRHTWQQSAVTVHACNVVADINVVVDVAVRIRRSRVVVYHTAAVTCHTMAYSSKKLRVMSIEANLDARFNNQLYSSLRASVW